VAFMVFAVIVDGMVHRDDHAVHEQIQTESLSNGRTHLEKGNRLVQHPTGAPGQGGRAADVAQENPKAAARWIPAVRPAAPRLGREPPRKRAIGTESSPHTYQVAQ